MVICCSPEQKEELVAGGVSAVDSVEYVERLSNSVLSSDAEVIVDLLFANDREWVQTLLRTHKTIIVNSVVYPLAEINTSFTRINAWPTFLRSSLIEASCLSEGLKVKAVQVLGIFNKQPEWLTDEAGFVTPRIISMIINEAYFALSEGVSTKEEIDTAMKLGTAYPYGPFEWAQKIGLDKIANLLTHLSRSEKRYTPSDLLLEEAFNVKKG